MKTFFKWVGILILIMIVVPPIWIKIDTTIAVNKYKPQENVEVPFGQKFSLKEGGKAHITGTDIDLTVSKFSARKSCSLIGAIVGMCGGGYNRSRVFLELKSKDFEYKFFGFEMRQAQYFEGESSKLPYIVKIEETDYKNYVNLTVVKQ